MSLQCLVFCSDEKILRLLRRVLSELEIGMEHCANPDTAIRILTRKRFEAVIVDCSEPEVAAQVLKSARSAPCNKRAVAVSIIDGQKGLRSAFDLGAHFVLYKPISAERAKSSFRAARALMKRERRRNARVEVQIPVKLSWREIPSAVIEQSAVSSDLGEGGIALQRLERRTNSKLIEVQFALPGSLYTVECSGEMAWENARRQTGIRFVDLTPEAREQLIAWLDRQSPDMEKEDPPISCKLSDLSMGACYLEVSSPFPVRTKLVLATRVDEVEVKAEGLVRLVHPEAGMGVEFSVRTPQQKAQIQKFIQTLVSCSGPLPNLLVQPEGIEGEPSEAAAPPEGESGDPLLHLFRQKADLAPAEFQSELRKQRGGAPVPKATAPPG
jgi:CheY-like chemotaxis protein